MKAYYKNIFLFVCSFSAVTITAAVNSNYGEFILSDYDLLENSFSTLLPVDSPEVNLPFQFNDNSLENPLYNNDGGLKLNDPANIKTDIDYDPATNQYSVTQKMGDLDYRPPTYMDEDDFMDYQFNKSVKDYWKQKVHTESQFTQQSNPLIPKIRVGGELFDRIFGGNSVDIRPQGSAELTFGLKRNILENPALPVKAQRPPPQFDFDQKIQLNVIAKIGDKLKLSTNYNTEATFDFENQMKLEYTGYDDEIIKKIEAGNVALPLQSSLITGSQTLFGIKTQMQFGRLTATSIFSQQKGKQTEIEVTGGASTSAFDINGDNYDANKHYFIGHYFRDQYNTALANLPIISSTINITKMEVWITNRNSGSIDNLRNIVAFSDLGEGDATHFANINFTDDDATSTLPKNLANSEYKFLVDTATGVLRDRDFSTVTNRLTFAVPSLSQVTDYEKLENARKLASTEYTFNPRLGYVSLNQSLNYDEVLAVAYQYTSNGVTYQVGEFSTDGISGQKPLVVKLLKSTLVSTKVPMWDLMMKNIYSIGAYQINPKDFKLNVLYNNAETGVLVNYIPEGVINGKPLIEVMGMDKTNTQLSPGADGVFDFLDGITIIASNGRIIFPEIEPFGKDLRAKFPIGEQTLANKYVYEQLYDSTRTVALQFPDKNRFRLKGTYQSSSSSEIPLNSVNIPQGSVVVTAGGTKLTENIDYTVDYTLGRVKIINEGILNSGTPIKIKLESNTLFSIQTRSLIGTRLDYKINNDFSLGGTVLNLTERPITQKVNIGDEPISNTIWGLDGTYRTEAPFLTRWIDKIPFINTKEISTISATGEFAQLIPGHSKAISKEGNSYIDDFEGSQTAIDIRTPSAWSLASTPQNQSMFPEGNLVDSLPYGFNRAKLSWYNIDPLFLRQTNGLTPGSIDNKAMSNHFVREIFETELFPNKQSESGSPVNISTFDLAFYPNEKGPYNYEATKTGLSGISSGIDSLGFLKNPETRWAGIMRKIETNDFEAANVEFIQFWMMDPYNDDYTKEFGTTAPTSGDMYIDLGNVSEDILKDSRKSFENGLPTSVNPDLPVDVTSWGKVPAIQPVVVAFDNEPSTRPQQDVGLDGLPNGEETSFFTNYLNTIAGSFSQGTSSAAYQKAIADPSSDDYHYYRGDDFDGASTPVLERYKKFNGMEGNSPTETQYKSLNNDGYPTAATNQPNIEDINRDNTLSESESYYQYKISLNPADIQPTAVGTNYITDVFQTTASTKDGSNRPITWYQFKVPIKSFESKVGAIEDFRSIRFIRVFFKNMDKPVVVRLARFDLVRSDWRKYNYDLLQKGFYVGINETTTPFNVAAVNIEENGSKTPVNYILPPKIEQEVNQQSANQVRINEQSLSMKVTNLIDGDSRAVFKNSDLDVRSYKKLKMFVHAEAVGTSDALSNGDVRLFVRLGTDYTDNYYEYEIPLQVTPPGNYNSGSESDRYIVWPEKNEMILKFEDLQKAKQRRNVALGDPSSGVELTTVYDNYIDERGNKISVIGNPNMSSIKVMMMGIRNPQKTSTNANDDALAKSVEVWVNELRLSDFDEKGGWAATAKVNAKLADLGNLSLSGNISTPGFGSIDKKVSERQRETIVQYDIATNLELGKFFPQDWNLKVPMYFGYGQTISNPQYNPLDPDIELKNIYKDPEYSKEEIKELKKKVQDVTERKSINFTNVKKEKSKTAVNQKPHFYDVENLAVSYSYNETFKHNINIENNTNKSFRGGLTYNYSTTPKSIKPFAKIKIFKSKYLALIRDFNLNTSPNRYGFVTDLNRTYSQQRIRNNTDESRAIPETFNKTYNMSRAYNLNYDISKTLKVDFSANNESRIDEPVGEIDTKTERDSIWGNIRRFGKTTNYRHNTNVSYSFPLNKIPLLDFASASVRYSSSYNWQTAPPVADTLGNTIQNSGNWAWNGQLNMVTLYNKIPYFKKINTKKKASSSVNAKNPAPADTSKNSTKNEQYEVLEYLARIAMSLKNVSVTYSNNNGLLMQGYGRRTNLMGFDNQFNAPGAGFIFGKTENFGSDNKEFSEYSASKGWLDSAVTLNLPSTKTHVENMSIKASIEPLPDIRIELTANRNFSKNNSSIFRWNKKEYVSESPIESGNFSMSVITWRTSFEKDNPQHTSKAFENFKNYRASISAQLGQKNANSGALGNGYYKGYGENSQDVVIPAFLAAYTDKNPDRVSTELFQKIPKPNWRITYDGLSKIEALQKLFQSVTLSHQYRSNYSINTYNTNLNYSKDKNNGSANAFDLDNNFISEYVIGAVSISEQYSPLIKLDMTWQNSLITNFEIKKDRNLGLSITNLQLTEILGKEYIIGTGYRIQDVQLPFKIGRKKLKSDLNLRVDFSIRNNITVIRKVVEDYNQVTSGTNVLTLKNSADYSVSDKLTVRVFWDKIINSPKVSNSYKTSNSNGGLSLRFTLSQ